MNPKDKEIFEQIKKIAESFQEDCHCSVKKILKLDPQMPLNSAIHAWMYKKLAEYEIRLRRLERTEEKPEETAERRYFVNVYKYLGRKVITYHEYLTLDEALLNKEYLHKAEYIETVEIIKNPK
jgi:hypothetical protein